MTRKLEKIIKTKQNEKPKNNTQVKPDQDIWGTSQVQFFFKKIKINIYIDRPKNTSRQKQRKK